MILLPFSGFSQRQNKFEDSTVSIKDTHLRFMPNFLIQNNHYEEIGENYVFKHYKDEQQGFFNVSDLKTTEYGFYSYNFYSGEAHAAEFIMLINEKADNILVLGYGDFNSNRHKLINFLNNNVNISSYKDKVLTVMTEELKKIYPKSEL